MKKLIYLGVCIFCSTLSFGQANRFSDLGVLLSQQELSGSARYKSLSGAMGAIGGDISTITNNPAGLGVFNHHNFTISAGSENRNTETSYFGNSIDNSVYDLKLNQIGLAFVFDRQYSDWKKTVLALNYQVTNNFDNVTNFVGNSGFASFTTHPNTNNTNDFTTAISQDFENEISGKSSVFSIGLASQHKENLYLGGSINFHNIDYQQITFLNERNENANGQILDAVFNQFDANNADGVSLNLGLIYKISHNFRIGLAYESPTWHYNIVNENNIFDKRDEQNFGRAEGGNGKDNPLDIKGNLDILPIDENIIDENIKGFRTPEPERLELFEYGLRTPSKVNLSTAFVLGKLGFLALDYSYHNYKSLNLEGNGGFNSENDYFDDVLVSTHNIRGGGEINIKNFMIRGGLSYEQSPFDEDRTEQIDVVRLGDTYGASLGAGLRIENHKFDLSFNYKEQNNTYDFFDQYDTVAPGEIELKQYNINLTYTYLF